MSDITIREQPGRWRILWAIARHDIRNILAHPYYMFTIGLPVLMSFMFAIFTGALAERDELVVAYFAPESVLLIDRLDEDAGIILQAQDSAAAVLAAVNDDATGGIVIPAGFDQAVAAGSRPELTVYVNVEARGANVARFRQVMTEQMWAYQETAAPITLSWSRQNGNILAYDLTMHNYLYLVLGMMSMAMVSMNIIPHLISEEREKAALVALMASPASSRDYLLGKFIAALAFTVPVTGIITILNEGWVGDWPVTMLTTLAILPFFTGAGLLIGLYTRTKFQCNTVTGIAFLVLLLPSWFTIVPFERLPALLRAGLQVVPTHYYANNVLQALTLTVQPEIVARNIGLLVVYGVVTYFLVIYRAAQQPLA